MLRCERVLCGVGLGGVCVALLRWALRGKSSSSSFVACAGLRTVHCCCFRRYSTLKLAATAVLRGATYQLGSGVNNSEDRSLLLGFDLSNVLT